VCGLEAQCAFVLTEFEQEIAEYLANTSKIDYEQRQSCANIKEGKTFDEEKKSALALPQQISRCVCVGVFHLLIASR
jgi:hypothetical protein